MSIENMRVWVNTLGDLKDVIDEIESRYEERIEDLSDEKQSLEERIEELEDEVSELQSDNVELAKQARELESRISNL